MDGIRLTSELRRLPRQRRLAIIGISAIQDSTLTARFLKAGADDYLQKPFNHEEFFCRVTRGIDFIENVRALEQAAFTDPLTGLHNRRYFFDRARRSHGEYQLAILDIDHFKRINDTYGHDAGDKVIIHVANMLRTHFPKEIVARLGGEEFVVLSTETSMLRFGKRLKLFQAELADSRVGSEQGPIGMTISIGAATQNEHMVLVETMKLADSRLYRAKVEGRNRLCVD
jgi:diguanylate cyclase (GGDEF)-like protein